MNTQPSDDHRSGLMRALAVAERIISTTPVIPTDIRAIFDCHHNAYVVEVYFHQAPGRVAGFAKAFGTTAVTRQLTDEDPRPYVDATGELDGVPFHAWCLGVAISREGQLVEQAHQVLDAAEPPESAAPHASAPSVVAA